MKKSCILENTFLKKFLELIHSVSPRKSGLLLNWESKQLTFKLLISRGGGSVETRQSKTEIVKHSSPKYHRFPALWDSKQIARISLRAKPSSVCRRFLAVP